MTIKELKNLSVETVSGTKLGSVSDVIFEIEGQLVAQYVVKQSFISPKSYLVSRDQVVRFEQDKMVVDDSVVRSEVRQTNSKKATARPEPVAMREQT